MAHELSIERVKAPFSEDAVRDDAIMLFFSGFNALRIAGANLTTLFH
jgi:hypothetical protein